MKKNIVIVLICLSLLVIGGVTTYFYLALGETPDYSNGMFVDRGEFNGYATVHDLYTCL